MIRLTLLLLCGVCFDLISQSSIEKVLASKVLEGAKVSIALTDMQSGEDVFVHHANQALIPASTIKLLSSVTALQQLGAAYRYRTEIGYTGELLADGTLVGDLYLIGSHDPTLGSDRIKGSPDLPTLLRLIAQRIQQKVTCIDGNLVVVSPKTDYTPERYWLYEDLGNYYGSPSYAVNARENQYELYLKRSTKADRQVTVHHSRPADLGMQWDCRVATASSGGDQAYILGAPSQYHQRIVGTIPTGKGYYRIRGALPDPPAYFAQRWSAAMSEYGIAHHGYNVVEEIEPYTHLTSIKSPPLRDIVQVVLHDSHNLYTEALYHALLSHGHTLETLPEPCKKVDACGLSPRNRMTARAFVEFIGQGQSPRQDLLAALPVAGRSGTMRSILQAPPYQGNIYAKSGSMTDVLCYVGYMRVGKRWRAFAILVNDYKGTAQQAKKVVEQLMKELYNVK